MPDVVLFMPFIASFALTLALTPSIARELARRGIVGVDLHKEDRRAVPEMAGVAILLGLLTSLLLYYGLSGDAKVLWAALLVLLVGLVGVADGLKRLSPLQKVSSLSIIGAILIPFAEPTILGHDLGWAYLLALPILFMAGSNFTNMLAGFNGMEIGTGAIASMGLALAAYGRSATALAISLGLSGALLAFLLFNRYPARAFPGDVGTLPIGAALVTAMVVGELEVQGLIIFGPYILDAALKYLSVGIMTRESQRPTILKEGKLYMPEGGNLSLPRLLLRARPMGEREVVYGVWALEIVACAMALAVGVSL